MLLRFSEDADKVIQIFIDAVDRRIHESGLLVDTDRRTDILLSVEHSVRVMAMKHAKKRGVQLIESIDACKATGHASPESVVKHALGDEATLARTETLRRKHLEDVKKKVNTSVRPALLDAGCGYGRQLMQYRRRGLEGEFVGVDVDIDALVYGSTVDASIHFVRSDIQGNLPFKEAVFDVVLCLGVLHETKKPNAVRESIRDFSRTLRQGGMLLLVDAFTRSRAVFGIMAVVNRFIPKVERYHLRNHVEKSLMHNHFEETEVEMATSMPMLFGGVYAITSVKGAVS